jgi:hypothetical protein
MEEDYQLAVHSVKDAVFDNLAVFCSEPFLQGSREGGGGE